MGYPCHSDISLFFFFQKRSRIDYTPEQLVVLETAWEGGMKVAGKKCLKEIEEVATALGVTTDRVRVNFV